MSPFGERNIKAGYYKIEILYHKQSANSTTVLIQTKGTLDAAYRALPHRLNQQIGAGKPNINNAFEPTDTNVTPFTISNAASYDWVSNNASNVINTGRLTVQMTDSGGPSGRMVADSVRITLISTIK